MKAKEYLALITICEQQIKDSNKTIKSLKDEINILYNSVQPDDSMTELSKLGSELHELEHRINNIYEEWYLSWPSESWDFKPGPYPELKSFLEPIRQQIDSIETSVNSKHYELRNQKYEQLYGEKVKQLEEQIKSEQNSIEMNKERIMDYRSNLLWDSEDLSLDPELITKIISSLNMNIDPTNFSVSNDGTIEFEISVPVSESANIDSEDYVEKLTKVIDLEPAVDREVERISEILKQFEDVADIEIYGECPDNVDSDGYTFEDSCGNTYYYDDCTLSGEAPIIINLNKK